LTAEATAMPRHTKSMRNSNSQAAAKARKDVAAFRESLWKTLDRNSKGLSGGDVVRALKVISDDVYHAGIDEAYTQAPIKDPRNVADAWDLTWVSALSVDLRRRQQARGKPRTKPARKKARKAR
jgi:hypothetical protein